MRAGRRCLRERRWFYPHPGCPRTVTQALESLRTIYRNFLDKILLGLMCSRSYTMLLFFISNVADDFALGGQRKVGSSPNHRSLRSATLLYLIFSCVHSHGNWMFRCRDIAGIPPPVTLNPFVRKYVASEGYVAYSTVHLDDQFYSCSPITCGLIVAEY
jgi:hypothetical protein